MNPPGVVVIFDCVNGRTERLAGIAAVGAVQARARIRLRRIGDSAGQAADGSELARMRRGYIPPSRTDIAWADAVVVAGPPEPNGDWSDLFAILEAAAAAGELDPKAVVVLDCTPAELRTAFEALPWAVLPGPRLEGAAGHRALVDGRRAGMAASGSHPAFPD